MHTILRKNGLTLLSVAVFSLIFCPFINVAYGAGALPDVGSTIQFQNGVVPVTPELSDKNEEWAHFWNWYNLLDSRQKDSFNDHLEDKDLLPSKLFHYDQNHKPTLRNFLFNPTVTNLLKDKNKDHYVSDEFFKSNADDIAGLYNEAKVWFCSDTRNAGDDTCTGAGDE